MNLGIINNSYMHVYGEKQRIGTRLFCNQVKEARVKSFRKIYTTAMGKEAGTEWKGYYCWGRLGYEMIAPDQEEFVEMMRQFGTKEKKLNELLASEDGRGFWLAFGTSWSGVFYLDDSHSNITNLKKYLDEAGVDYKI